MRRTLAVGLLFALSLGVLPSSADGADQVVVTVGTTKVTVGELEQRLSKIPPYQLATLGSSPSEIKKRYVDEVLVPELLAVAEAEKRGLDQEEPAHRRVLGVLQKAVADQVREEAAKVTPDEVKDYYEANRHRFNTPKRVKIWRILVASEDEAKKLIASLHGTDLETQTKWNTKARDSLDKSTGMRNGDIGFVAADGETETPQLRVDPALFAAADQVKDGEMVQKPVKEGDRWAVVWRRGSLDPVVRTLAQESPNILKILAREKVEDAVKNLAKKLRDEHLKNVATELLEYVDIDPNGDVGTRQKPGIVSRHDARGTPAPRRSERGLR